MTEKEFDKLFKEKLQDREFKMNPDNWAAMEQILDSTAKAGGAFYWRSVAVIAGFALLVGSSALWLSPTATEGNDISHQEQQLMDKPETAPISAPAQGGEISHSVADGETETTPAPDRKTTADRPEAGNTAPPVATNTGNAAGNDATRLNSTSASSENQRPLAPEEAAQNLALRSLAMAELPLPALSLMTPRPAAAPELEVFNPRRHHFFVTAASVAGNSFGNPSPGIGYSLGVGYRYQPATKLSLEASARYLQLSNISIKDQHDSTFFNFGRERIHTRREITQLQYLQLPVNLTYHLNARHSLSLGGYTAVLLSVTENLERSHELPKRSASSTSSTLSGYDEDFRRFDYGIQMAYFYRASASLSLGVEVQHGFADITKKVSEGFRPAHYNFNTQLSLRYHLF